MNEASQVWTIFRCALIGFAAGVIYEAFSILRYLTGCKKGNKRKLTAFFDVCFFFCFAVFAVFCGTWFGFSEFRAFMAVGYGLGIIIYLKTLHRIVAFFEKVCYNRITKVIKIRKRNKERRKPQKAGEYL